MFKQCCALSFLFFLEGTDAGKIQSLILCAIFLVIGFQIIVLSVIADIVAANRRLIENIQYNVRVNSFSKQLSPIDSPKNEP